MAEALWRLRGGRTRLLTALGDDADGQYLDSIAPGMVLDGCIIKGSCTSSYAAVLDSRGECLLGLGDMALHNCITPDLVKKHMKVLEESPLIVLDGNAPQDTIDYVLAVCERLNKPVFFEPTDRRKATKALYSKYKINYASPNLLELREMSNVLTPSHHYPETNCNDFTAIKKLSTQLLGLIKVIFVTLGPNGVVTIRSQSNEIHNTRLKEEDLIIKCYPTYPIKTIENVSGAGDSFSSGVIHGIIRGLKESQCMALGFKAAQLTLMSKNTVSSDLNNINVSLIDDAKYEYIK